MLIGVPSLLYPGRLGIMVISPALALYPVLVVEPEIEPHRRVECALLGDEDVDELVLEGLRFRFLRKIIPELFTLGP